MKISDLFLKRIPFSNIRCCKSPIPLYKKSKIIKFFGLDRIEYYIYCKYWHSVHTQEEMKGECFYCTICDDPDYFDKYFSLWMKNRIANIFMGLPRFFLKLKVHLWHILALSMPIHPGCSFCCHKYFKDWTIEKHEKFWFWDATIPSKKVIILIGRIINNITYNYFNH